MAEITYDAICEKLGFDVDTYQPPKGDTEDANGESPFRKLTLDELTFLTDRIEKSQNA